MATVVSRVDEESDGEKRGIYVRECLKLYNAWRTKHQMPDNEDSLVEWDRVENSKKLLDWNEERNVARGLREQAHWILSNYYRLRVVTGDMGISMPLRLKNPVGDYEKIDEMDSATLDAIIEQWQAQIRMRYVRIRLMKAGPKQLKIAINRAVSDAESEARKLIRASRSTRKTRGVAAD